MDRKEIKLGITLAVAVLLFVLMFLVYSKNINENVLDKNAQNIGYTEYKENETFIITDTIGDDLKLNRAQGITYLSNRIFVSDTNNDRLLILNKNGELIKEVGKTGNAQGEFIKPRGLTTDKDGNVLIADSGNNRIEIFDSEGNFKDQIYINDFNTPYKSSEYIRDVEADSMGYIYVSTYAYYEKRQCIYVYNDNNLVNIIKCKASGLLSKCNNEIYFLADVELIKSNNERKLRPGNTYICKVTPRGLDKIYKLNNSSSPKSICYYNNNYYILYKPMPSIDMLENDLEYKGTIFSLEWNDYKDYKGFTDMTIDEDGKFYCIDDNNNSINILQKEE